MSTYTKKQVSDLVKGTLDWDTVHLMLSMPKDEARYKLYMEVLQENVSYDDKIILAVGPHLNIVESSKDQEIIIKCDCGHEFGHYSKNWKLNALIYVRDNVEKMKEYAFRRRDEKQGSEILTSNNELCSLATFQRNIEEKGRQGTNTIDATSVAPSLV